MSNDHEPRPAVSSQLPPLALQLKHTPQFLNGEKMRAAIIASLMSVVSLTAAAQDTALVGLWQAKKRFGPDLRGELIVQSNANGWRAQIRSRAVDARVRNDSVYADFPAGGTFTGILDHDRGAINGFWIQPPTMRNGGRYSTHVMLTACGNGCYTGQVRPLEDEFTWYVNIAPRSNGRLGAFLRNPDRNQGRFMGVDNVIRRGDSVLLRDKRDSTLVVGSLSAGTLTLPLRGGTFDFDRVPADSFTYFYARGRPTATYVYTRPLKRHDGWSVATPEEVGMSREKLSDMARAIVNGAVDSANAFRPHAILIARHGKLVFEEYFYGGHAEESHDTRSASKTLVSLVLGAAMQAGMKVSPETPVFETMGARPDTLEPRKRALKLGHLLQMSSGLDCDDTASVDRPGSEEVFINGNNPDWLGIALGLKMIRNPGEKAVYCSINPYFASVVIARATGRPFVDLAWDLVGKPLQADNWHIGLAPHGEAYMGGGSYFGARDFTKWAQLYASGGVWNGKRIVSQKWTHESGEPTVDLQGTHNYGYLWWSSNYTFKGKPIQAHEASGNGGQFSVYIPDLDLVVGVFGGNYADRGGFYAIRELIPNWILPAIVK